MRIALIGHNLWGVGGTVRTVYNLAEGLSAASHSVELVSLYRRTTDPAFTVPRGVKLVSLVDGRPGSADRRRPQYFAPSIEVPPTEELYSQNSLLTDSRLRNYLETSSADVLVGTRASINLLLARYGRGSAVRVGQEHTGHEHIPDPLREHMRREYPALDAVVTVTDADASLVRESLALPDTPVIAIPNSIPAPLIRPSTLDTQLIIGAGRLEPAKRFELLVHAFAQIADDYPHWNVRLYGTGSSVRVLRDLVQTYGLVGRIRLMGAVQNMRDEWTKASIAVSTSDAESFGMTLVEAMRAGAPLISTDCPTGPREILTHEKDGLLIPTGSVDDLAAALGRLMASPDERRRLSAAGLERGADFDVENVARRHLALFENLARRTGRHGRRARSLARELAQRVRRPRTRTTITVHAYPAGELEFEVDREGGLPLAQSTLTLSSSHPDDTPVTYSLTRARHQRVHVSAESFTNDATWNGTFTTDSLHLDNVTYLIDNRHLIGAPIPSGRVKHVAPYLEQGELRLRAWKRNHHTEVRRISVAELGITVEASTSFKIRPEGNVTLTRRTDGVELRVAMETSPSQDSLRFHVPVAELVRARIHRHEDWDVIYKDDNRKSKVARILDDIPNRRTIDSYSPWSTLESAAEDSSDVELVHVRPYYTPTQSLAVSVVGR